MRNYLCLKGRTALLKRKPPSFRHWKRWNRSFIFTFPHGNQCCTYRLHIKLIYGRRAFWYRNKECTMTMMYFSFFVTFIDIAMLYLVSQQSRYNGIKTCLMLHDTRTVDSFLNVRSIRIFILMVCIKYDTRSHTYNKYARACRVYHTIRYKIILRCMN